MIRYSCLLSPFILTSPLPVLSQALPGTAATEKPYTVSVDVDLVLFNVIVLDDKNRLIPGLTSRNFRVYEDNREQEIRSNTSRDGLFRNVRIAVVDKNGKPLKVRTRAGYLASKRASQVLP
jgi:hypothetical protein